MRIRVLGLRVPGIHDFAERVAAGGCPNCRYQFSSLFISFQLIAPPKLKTPVSHSLIARRAERVDAGSIRWLHDVSLEVRYEASFFDTLFDASLLCLVMEEECDGGAGSSDDGGVSAASGDGQPRTEGRSIVGVLTARAKVSDSGGVDAPDGGASSAPSAGTATGLYSLASRAMADAFSLSPPPPPCAYIMTLCVAPRARRQGVGRALLHALRLELASGALSKQRGAALSRIELNVLTTNGAALALYAAEGFSTVCTVPRYYYFADAHHDAFLMAADAPSEPAASDAESAAAAYHGHGMEQLDGMPSPLRKLVEWLASVFGFFTSPPRRPTLLSQVRVSP